MECITAFHTVMLFALQYGSANAKHTIDDVLADELVLPRSFLGDRLKASKQKSTIMLLSLIE